MQYIFSPAVSPNRETLKHRQTIHEFNAKMPNLIFFSKIKLFGNFTISNLKYHYNRYIFFHVFRQVPYLNRVLDICSMKPIIINERVI